MAKERKPGKVHSLEFRAAKNALISRTTTKYDRGPTGGGPTHDYEDEEMSHPTMGHAVKHMKATMGHVFGEAKEPGEREPASTDEEEGTEEE